MVGTHTPNYDLYKPVFEEEGWDDEINGNFDTIDTELNELRVALTAGTLKSGMIVIWKGSIATIPSGMVFCNGSNNTSDLRGKFVLGAQADSGATYDVNDTGGEETHLLLAAESGVPPHSHTFPAYNGGGSSQGVINNSGCGVVAANHSTGQNTGANAAQAHNNMPPYYALAYIMKT
jgi:hypothetical protein